MKEIPVHEIRDRQTLAENVICSETGQVLLAAGVELKRLHAQILELRGVLTVKIVSAEGPDQAGGAEGDEEPPAGDQFADAISRLEHMFEGLDGDPIMRAIHSAARGMVEAAMKGEAGE